MDDRDTEAGQAKTAVESAGTRDFAAALRNALKMGGSLLVTWSVALVVKLRVPAYLGPVRQGHFGFAESFAGMFFATLGLGVDLHLMKEVARKPKYASDIVGGVFVLRLIMSVALFAAMWLVLWVTGRSKEVIVAVTVFGVMNLVLALNGTLTAVLQASAYVDPAAVANVVTKAVWGAGLLIGLHYGAPLPLLALPGLLGEVVRIAILAPATKEATGLQYRIDVPAVREALLESVPYFVNSLALGVLSSLGMSVLEFVRVDEREVGWFAADQNVASLCMLLTPLLFWIIMPLLSRAHARSEEEGMEVFRRCIEGVVVTIVPITVLISAGSDVWIHLAFGDKYAPAHTGLSILSLVFMMTYMNMMLGMNLIILHRGWSVTVISICAVFVTAGLMLVLVPLGRHLVGEGGECAGAAASVIGSEACVLVAMLSRFSTFPLDSRNVRVFAKSAGLAAAILIADRYLRGLGPLRLVIDGVLYVAIAPVIGVARIQDIGTVIRLMRYRGKGVPAASAAGPS